MSYNNKNDKNMNNEMILPRVPYKEEATEQGPIIYQKYVARILTMLLDEPEIYATAFKKRLSANYDTIKRVTGKMEENGLITINPESRPQITHIIKLTEKGKRIAELLKEAQQISEEG